MQAKSTGDAEHDPGGLTARLALQSRLLEVMRHDLEAERQASEAKDRGAMETWRRLHLHELLLAQAQRDLEARTESAAAARAHWLQERAQLLEEQHRLLEDLSRLRSTWSWRLTTPLRLLGRPTGRRSPTP